MPPLFRLFLLAGLPLVLASCTTQRVAKGYIGPSKPLSEIAIIKASADRTEFRPAFVAHSDSGNDLLAMRFGDSFSAYPSEVHMLPGRYYFEVHCGSGNEYGHPKIRVSAAAGMTYEIRCARAGLKDRDVRVGVSKSYPSVPSGTPAPGN